MGVDTFRVYETVKRLYLRSFLIICSYLKKLIDSTSKAFTFLKNETTSTD